MEREGNKRGRKRSGSKDEDGTYGNEIPPPNPIPKRLRERSQRDPLAPSALDDAALEQRAGEQQAGQQQRLGELRRADGPDAQQAQDLAARGVHVLREDVHRAQGARGARGGDEADARRDDGRAVARDGRRGPRGGREVEGEDVEGGEEDLGWRVSWDGWEDEKGGCADCWRDVLVRKGMETVPADDSRLGSDCDGNLLHNIAAFVSKKGASHRSQQTSGENQSTR